MSRRTASGRRQVVFGMLLGIVGLLTWCTTVWATTQLGNVELQAWYRQRNTFQTDGGEHVSWDQWRNEFFAWMVYENMVENGRLFNQVDVPFLESATFNARYRLRVDPVYSVRDHFENLYDGDERETFLMPENGFRDLFLDMDFGQVGPGSLSVRVGNQQIVWGESDLFRSLDIINPLRIDQNQAVGEKFDEFRSPLLAFKALYVLGNIGQYFSDVAIEPFYTPRFRSGTSDLILDGVFRAPHHIKGCLDDNNNLVRFESGRCAQARADGSRVFVPYRPPWIGNRRSKHPFSIFYRGPNARNGTPDYICLDPICSPDVVGHRATFLANLRKAHDEGSLNGTGMHAAGVRVLGKTWFNVDFTLNYMYLPSGPNGVFDINKIVASPGGPPVGFRPDTFFGDTELTQSIFGVTPAGSFEEGLRRCLSDGGKVSEGRTPGRAGRVSTILVGADLLGYNQPERFGPNGALAPDGNARPGRHQAARPPITFCLPGVHDYVWTHVMGFTGTYNDFDYTGAILRFEQSFSTKEVIRAFPPGFGRRAGDGISQRVFSDDFDKYTGVWRSMVGFDLFRSLSLFRYIPGIHPSFYTQAWFISGQWLMENNWNNVANNICQNVDNVGNGFVSEEDIRDFRRETGLRAYSSPQCRRQRWNNLFTLVLANNGLFGGKLETRNAVAYEPRDEQTLLYTQNWWRGLFGIPNLEVSFGVAWYTGSGLGTSWSSLQHFADRDQFWFEFTYYLL